MIFLILFLVVIFITVVFVFRKQKDDQQNGPGSGLH